MQWCGTWLMYHPLQLVILKTLNSKTNESHQREIQNIQDLLEQKERTAQEHDDHILDLNNKIADLKLYVVVRVR